MPMYVTTSHKGVNFVVTIDKELRLRDSYKRFVKTWIRFANPWIRTVSWITNP